MIITIKHIKAAGMCSSGARLFAKNNGFDWSDFVKNGIPIEKLPTDNALVNQVLEVAKNGK